MATYPSFRAGATTQQASNSSNSLVVNKPTGTVEGDDMIAFIFFSAQADLATNTVTPPAGWAEITTPLVSIFVSGYYFWSQAYAKKAGASEPSTYTWTISARTGTAFSDDTGTIATYTGGPGVMVYGRYPTISANATAHVLATQNTVADESLAIDFITARDGTPTWSADAGFTERHDSGGVLVADKQMATQGAVGSRTHTASSSQEAMYTTVILQATPTTMPTLPTGLGGYIAGNTSGLALSHSGKKAPGEYGFVTSDGTWVVCDGINSYNANSFQYVYSTNGGSTWTPQFSALNPSEGTYPISAPLLFFYEQANDILFVFYFNSSHHLYAQAFDWDSTNKVFNRRGAGSGRIGNATSWSITTNVVGGVDTGVVYLAVTTAASGTPNINTAKFTISTNGWSDISNSVSAWGNNITPQLFVKAASGADARVITNVTSGVAFYAVYNAATTLDLYIQAYSYSTDRYAGGSTAQISADNDQHVLAAEYLPASDRFVVVTQIGTDLRVYKSDSADPLSTWTKVWQMSTDEGSPPTLNSSIIGNAFIDRENEMVYIASWDQNTVGSDYDIAIFVYDVGADTHNMNIYTWGGKQGDLGVVTAFDPVASVQNFGFLFELRDADDDPYLAYYLVGAGGGGLNGFGFIPLGF